MQRISMLCKVYVCAADRQDISDTPHRKSLSEIFIDYHHVIFVRTEDI
jgi:hypothetical protein